MAKKLATAQRPQKILPTGRIAVAKHLDMLRAYAIAPVSADGSVSKEEAGKVIDLAEYTMTLAEAFFKDVGFLAKGESGFIVAKEVHDFARAHEFNPDTAARKLAPNLADSWFGRCLVSRLRMRKITEDDAIAALAEEAKATANYRDNLKSLIDFLVISGVISRSDGYVQTGPSVTGEAEEQEDGQHQKEKELNNNQRLNPPPPPGNELGNGTGSTPQNLVSFSVSMDVSMEEISKWEPDRISAFFAGLAQVLAAKKGL